MGRSRYFYGIAVSTRPVQAGADALGTRCNARFTKSGTPPAAPVSILGALLSLLPELRGQTDVLGQCHDFGIVQGRHLATEVQQVKRNTGEFLI
jgi:hypothetical protein